MVALPGHRRIETPPPPRPPSALKLRVYSGFVGVPVVLGAIYLGVPTTAALISLACVIAMFEFHRMTIRAGTTPIFFLGITGVVLFVVARVVEFNFLNMLITGTVLAPLYLLLLTPPRERFLADWAWTMAGVFLIGWTMSHAVLIRRLPDGRDWLFTGVILVFAIDSGAYIIGHLVGTHRMAPNISPGKTWEGAVAGVVFGIVAAVLTTAAFGLPITSGQAALLGFLISVLSQMGGLANSMLKRTAGVKDSGALIPGHGGLLDRLDSLIPSVVVLYYFLTEGIGVK